MKTKKAIEDQREKQIKAIKKYAEDTPLTSKQKEIFNKLADERLEEMANLDKKVDCDDLIYKYKGNAPNSKFDKSDDAFSLLNKIRDGKISLANAKSDQEIL